MESQASFVLNSLSLRDSNHLNIKYAAAGVDQECQVDLDEYLGATEGKFVVRGRDFSRNAKDIKLVNDVLHATLKSSNGVWWRDQIGIDVELLTDAGPPTLTFRSLDFMRLKGCRNVRVIDGFLLTCEILQNDFTYADAWVDLDVFLGNVRGGLSRHGVGFWKGSTNVVVVGSTLYADMKNREGVVCRSSIKLTDILEVRGRLLAPLRTTIKPESYDFESVRDTVSERHWLPFGGNCRLICHRTERKWYLIAHCPAPDGVIRESAIDLSMISSGYYYLMLKNYSQPTVSDGSEFAAIPTLENGRLTAPYVVSPLQELTFAIDWARPRELALKTIDLKQVLVNSRGRLNFTAGSHCLGCRHLFWAGYLYNTDVRRIPIDTDAISRKENRKSCALCQLIYDATQSYCRGNTITCDAWLESKARTPDIIHHPNITELVIKRTKKNSRFNLLSRAAQKVETTRLTIFLEPGGKEYYAKGIPDHLRTLRINPMPGYIYPLRRWDIVQSWIAECVRDHKKCRDDAGAELPSRWLDIGTKQHPVIRVVTSTKGQMGTYACLSHCWGGKIQCTLNELTMEKFSTSIPESILPSIFREAISISRRLGIGRLWIDSLCIQQDSLEDWQDESSKMGQYYSNCFICIAATSSPNSSGSLNIDRNPEVPVIRATGRDAQTGPFALVAIPSDTGLDIEHFVRTDDKHELTAKFPLMSRAWCMQERWLSPRTLHFCEREVIFECSTTTTCECGRVTEEIKHDGQAAALLFPSRSIIKDKHWIDIITEYSTRDLTYATDRLVALSGLAADVQNRHMYIYKDGDGDTGIPRYLAGLWREELGVYMSWFVGEALFVIKTEQGASNAKADIPTFRSKPADYLGPSWSWVSVLDPVSYPQSYAAETQFRLLTAHVSLASNNPFGRVREGCYLRLRGFVKETSWAVRRRESGREDFILRDIVGTQALDRENVRGIRFSLDCSLTDLGPGEQLSVLPLIQTHTKHWGLDSRVAQRGPSWAKSCLVLRKADGASLPGLGNGNVYQRIGYTEYGSFQDGVRDKECNSYQEQDIVLM
ncbi:heterokaryon incompatibility protein-domain-containing protein [Xylaria grammica]|nr:heterokaryon incompatibility protein-domain-containing protein [Xylaria grammica]